MGGRGNDQQQQPDQRHATTGRATAPKIPRPMAEILESVSLTPRPKSIRGMETSPSILMATIRGDHTWMPAKLTAKPAMVASTEGTFQTLVTLMRWSSSQAPKLKCIRLETMNSTTAGARAASPKASTDKGRPRLPALLNMMGGAKVLGSSPAARAMPQPARPEPMTTTRVHTSRGKYWVIWKSLPARAAKTREGTKTSMLSLLAWVRSGWERRPTQKPTAVMAKRGKRMETMRSSMKDPGVAARPHWPAAPEPRF